MKTETTNTQPIVIKCKCGYTINEDNVEYTNKCNEEGEDFCEITAECEACGAYYETSTWGEVNDKQEAMFYMEIEVSK